MVQNSWHHVVIQFTVYINIHRFLPAKNQGQQTIQPTAIGAPNLFAYFFFDRYAETCTKERNGDLSAAKKQRATLLLCRLCLWRTEQTIMIKAVRSTGWQSRILVRIVLTNWQFYPSVSAQGLIEPWSLPGLKDHVDIGGHFFSLFIVTLLIKGLCLCKVYFYGATNSDITGKKEGT